VLEGLQPKFRAQHAVDETVAGTVDDLASKIKNKTFFFFVAGNMVK
jgi:hypothetical protein